MSIRVLAISALLAFTLAGCTEGDQDLGGTQYTGPMAALSDRDVPIDGSAQDWVECPTKTHLIVIYEAGDKAAGDFTIYVYSESSRQTYDEDGNPTYDGIRVFGAMNNGVDEGTFSGAQSGTFETDISGTDGTWLLEGHRSQFHDGIFSARLFCA